MFDKDLVQAEYPEAVMYEPMKIHGSTDLQLQNACASGNYFGQFKKDGYWYQYEKHPNHQYLFSRTTSRTTGLLTEKIDNVPHIAQALQCLPDETILIGEIYYPGGTSKTVTSIMGCLSTKAVERQEGKWGWIHYYIHDILMYDGVDLYKGQVDNWTRYKILEKIYHLHNLDQYPFLELAQSWEDNLYLRVGAALDSGEEGMVIKKKTGLYEPGKRPDSNLKAKKVDFADVVITGFEPPVQEYHGKDIGNWQYWMDTSDGMNNLVTLPIGLHNGEDDVLAVTKPYYMGWYNSDIKIGAYDADGKLIDIGTIHSGISDDMKQDMTENPENYLNKVAKIQMMEKDSVRHTIRHGFFRGLHEDKNAEDCTIDSIFCKI